MEQRPEIGEEARARDVKLEQTIRKLYWLNHVSIRYK